MKENEFGEKLKRWLSPSEAIQTPELLKGRDRQLQDIRQAWHSGGRQIFIYGFRGVGKTSLAHTAAFQQQSTDAHPIILTCAEGATFFDLIHDMFSKGFPSDPREVKRVLNHGASLNVPHLSGELKQSIEKGRVPAPKSINEAILLTEFLALAHSKSPVVIVDEFDLLKDKKEQGHWANFVKQIGDQKIGVKFIFCGIGESIEELLHAHESAYRYFHAVPLERLDFEPRLEIVTTAAKHLNISIDETTRMRIAKISDGFPHFIHLLCEKLFWIVFNDQAGQLAVSSDEFEAALTKAAEAIQPYLKRPYEKATRKYSNACEEILWAVADHHQLQRPTRQIFESYVRIMETSGRKPLTQIQFYQRMNSLKTPAYGEILIGTRTGWYEFREKMLRGYARLRASQEGVELDIEHPLQAQRFRKLQ